MSGAPPCYLQLYLNVNLKKRVRADRASTLFCRREDEPKAASLAAKMRSDLKGATSSLLELQSYSIEHEPANDTVTDAASYISTTIPDALSLQTFANCSSKPHVGGSSRFRLCRRP